MKQNKALHDLDASLNIIRSNIKIFNEGNIHVYRVIAVELRKLLCDNASTLLPRVFPGLCLHPLVGYITREINEKFSNKDGRSLLEIMEMATFRMSSLIFFDGKGGSRIVRMFDESAPIIPIDEWLLQPLFNNKITVKELIRSVADKESAHSDNEYNDTLKFVRSIKLVDESIHIKHIVAIGEYINNLIDPMFDELMRDLSNRPNDAPPDPLPSP